MTQLLIRFNETYRDAIQSLFGTAPSADEIIAAHPNAHKIGSTTIQTGGGTFFDIFARNGRDEWEEVEKIITHFKEKYVRQTALVRGDCMFGYKPLSYDVIKATVREYALMGMNVFQNFHGLNDIDAMKSVAQAINEVRKELAAEGTPVDIEAQGAICIEDNPNITVESCLEFADQLIATGHKGFYLKSASGCVDPEFVRKLTAALIKKYPEQSIDIHVHSTYGKAPACYMAAMEEGIERDHPIGIDVQHPAMSGSTAQPSMLKMISLMRNHPNPKVKAQALELDKDAIEADEKALLEMRFRYREFEASYNHELLKAMRAARAPGGASATLRKIPGLEENLSRLLGTTDWDEIQIAIYKMQAKILDDLGQPTQVTPYALMTTNQAVICLFSELNAQQRIKAQNPDLSADEIEKQAEAYRWDNLHGDAVGYLTGALGKIPETTNPDLIQKALDKAGLDEVIEYVPAAEKPDNLPHLEEELKNAGIEKPTVKQCISANMIYGDTTKAVEHIIACANNTNKPNQPPELPYYAQEPTPEEDRRSRNGVSLRGIRNVVTAIGGHAKLQEMAERVLHIRQIDDGLYIFPKGEECLESRWRTHNVDIVSDFLNSIPDFLSEAGFTQKQILSYEFKIENALFCIKDTCDSKGRGMFDHMQKVVKEHNESLEQDKTSDADMELLDSTP